MTDGHYILPGELLLLAVFVFAPAVALGLGIQAFALAKMGLLAGGKYVVAALCLTAALGVSLAITLFVLSPDALGPLVGLREVRLLGHSFFVLPAAFICIALAGVLSTLWLRRRRTRGEA
jgi:hypothetical protein